MTDLKTRFLLTALPDVVFDGWTDDLMQRTAKKLKTTPAKAFPGGVEELILYFLDWATDETVAAMEKPGLDKMRVRDRITMGVRAHIEVLQPHKQAFSAALSAMAKPPRSLHLARSVWRAADRIWWTAGDTATDYNHYTKRGLLAGVLTATTLYWLNDDSRDMGATWDFLDRRIENVMKIGQTLGRFGKKKA